jgi:drug/metabolite transporter (DMT)-like permease
MSHYTKQNPTLAALYMSVATAFIAGTTLLAKALGSDQFGTPLHPFQVTFGRFVFALIAIVLAASLMRLRVRKVHWGLHSGRTLCGWMGATLMFAAAARIPLADATALAFLNPVFGMIFAIPFLGERVGPWRWTAACIGLLGAAILLRPAPASFEPAALLAFAAAVIMGIELIFIKQLARREAPIQILLINNLLGASMATSVALFFWQAPSVEQWLLLAGLGVMMAAAQVCFVNGVARADASFVAPFSYGTLVFAALYDVMFYRVIPDWVTFLGAGVIISGAMLLAWREGRARGGL